MILKQSFNESSFGLLCFLRREHGLPNNALKELFSDSKNFDFT